MNITHRLRAIRSAVALSAELTSPVAQRSETFTHILNLSGTGALLETDKIFTEGELVLLRFSLPGRKEVQAEARVARVIGAGPTTQVGVAFETVEERTLEMIVGHVVQEDRRRLAHAV